MAILNITEKNYASAQRITVNTNVDFHERIEFLDDGSPADLTGWVFRFKFVDEDNNILATVEGSDDGSEANVKWFNAFQTDLANFPLEGVKWYLLSQDPDGYVGLVAFGKARIKGGASWSA